jgi:hypothetical protein
MAEEVKVEQEKVLLSWTAKSRPYKPAEQQTRLVMLVLGVLIALVLAFAGEWMLIMVLIAGAFFYYAWNRMPPEEVEFLVTNKGVRAFGRLYLWWEFSSWWLEEKWTSQVMVLNLNSGLINRLYIPVEGIKIDELKKVVNMYLLFLKPPDSPVDTMTKWVAEKFPLQNKI